MDPTQTSRSCDQSLLKVPIIDLTPPWEGGLQRLKYPDQRAEGRGSGWAATVQELVWGRRREQHCERPTKS